MRGHKQSGSRQLNRHWQSGGRPHSNYYIQNLSYNDSLINTFWRGNIPLEPSTLNSFAGSVNSDFTLPMGGKITCKTTGGINCHFINGFTLATRASYTPGYGLKNSFVYLTEEFENTPLCARYGYILATEETPHWCEVKTFISSIGGTEATNDSITIPANTTNGVIHCATYFGYGTTADSTNNVKLCEYDLTITTDADGLQIEQSNLSIENESVDFYVNNSGWTTFELFNGGAAYYAIKTSETSTNQVYKCSPFARGNAYFYLNNDEMTDKYTGVQLGADILYNAPAILYSDGKVVQK